MIRKTSSENKDKGLSGRRQASLVFGLTLSLGLPLALWLAFTLAFWGRVYPRVKVCQVSLTGKNAKEAQATLNQNLTENQPQKLVLSSPGRQFTLDLSSLRYRPEISVQSALKFGRERNPLANLRALFSLLEARQQLGLDYLLDENKLDQEIGEIAAKLYLPPVEPEVKILNRQPKTVVVQTGENGQEVNQGELKEAIRKKLACPEKEISAPIPLTVISPKISSQQAKETEERAKALLGKEIKLRLDEQSWTIGDEENISFLSFAGGFDRQKITAYAQELGKTINVAPENAAFQFENNRVNVFRPSKEGVALREADFINNFEKSLALLETQPGNREMVIPVTKTAAKISTESVNNLGIKELLGEGTSLFRGSIPGRIDNIKLASLRLNGILVAPGEEFSFNHSLGEVSADTGYKQAYIIKEGRTVLGDGGGVCQVSTTLFRAALKAGLTITERHAHAYRVHYYEDDLGPGFDATVFDPTADLKFKNDTGHYILIQSKTDVPNRKLTFDLYGTADSRQATISKARVWDKQPPPPDLYQDDPTLPVGTVKQIDWAAWGAKAAFDYKVTRNAEVLEEKTFSSVYRPWQAIYLRGTGR